MSRSNVTVQYWGVLEVAEWLASIHLGGHREKFAEQQITGQDLLDLTEADLIELGFTTLGQRKKLQRKIADLGQSHAAEFGGEDDKLSSHSSEHDSTSSWKSSETGGSAKAAKRKIKVKCFYRKDVRIITIKPTISYANLARKIREEYNRTVDIFWEDDGDSIKIASDRQLQTAIKMTKGDTMKLTLQRRSKKSSSSKKGDSEKSRATPDDDFSLLEFLVDACIVIESDGYILFFNKAAEKIFGYNKTEVIGKNVNILMTDMYAARHDSYLENYLRTGRKKIIGTTRNVLGKHKSGKTLGLSLSLSERKNRDGRHTFTGILKEVEDKSGDNFSLLDSLLEAVICIDETGIILHANPKALTYFGYDKNDVLNQNVSMLMPPPHKDNHNSYLSRYLQTGKATVIGKTRDTICELSDGSISPIRLSVSETSNNGRRQFIGTISARQTNQARKVSLLVQQRQVIETLATPAIIIDSHCSIQAFNQSALRVLKYTLDEVLGQNVNMVVGIEHSSNHDDYVQRYLDTRQAKVIGKDRKLKARPKTGPEIEIILSVTEHQDGDKVFFTGMFFPAK